MRLSDRATIERFKAEGIWGDATLPALFRNNAQRNLTEPAVCDPPNKADVCGGPPLTLTYAQLLRAVANMTRRFRALGLCKDDVIAFQLPNTVEQVVVIIAALEAGLIVSPLPLLWREHEIGSALKWIAPRLLVSTSRITGRAHAEMMCRAAAEQMSVRGVMAFGDDVPDGVMPLSDIFAQHEAGDEAGLARPEPAPGADDVATICWDGGDDPLPAAVPRSHNQWIAAGMMQVLEAGLGRGASILAPYPLTSLLSIGSFLVPWLLNGGTLHLHHPFDLTGFVGQLRDNEIAYTGLPPAVIDLLKSEGVFDTGQPAARLTALACIWPGVVLPKDADERASDLMVPVIDVRTLGEMAYHARRRVAGERPGLIGRGDITFPSRQVGGVTLLTTRVKGGILSNGQATSLLSGDLMIRSPMMFDAYFPAADEGVDEPVLARDSQGYANTGLRCLLTGSTVPRIELRRRDGSIVYMGGLAVSASELDGLYRGHEQVADAAVFSFDDPVMGERIIAAIEPVAGASVSLSDLAEYLTQRCVAPYKIPDQLVVVSMIPRDKSGAVQRDRLMEFAGGGDASRREAAAVAG